MPKQTPAQQKITEIHRKRFDPLPDFDLAFQTTTFDSRNDGGEKNSPLFANVFNDAGLLYKKAYQVVHFDYGMKVIVDEDNPKKDLPALLDSSHIRLYELLLMFAEHGNHFTPTKLARRLGCDGDTLSAWLDRLEDAELITRIRCLNKDFRIYIYVHSPFSPGELLVHRERLAGRIKDKATKTKRAALGKNKFPLLRFDLDFMRKAFLREKFDADDSQTRMRQRERSEERKKYERRLRLMQAAIRDFYQTAKLAAGVTAEDWFGYVEREMQRSGTRVTRKDIITAVTCINLNLRGENLIAAQVYL